MSNSVGLGMVTLELRGAFRQPGCPICRVGQGAANRYIFHLLWEYVNDYTTRLHLVRSLGFCAEHTWQLYHTEVNQYGDGLGISIIYEHLTRLIVDGLRDLKACLSASTSAHRRWWQRGWDRVRAAWRQTTPSQAPHLGGLVPSEECRVCFCAKTTEHANIGWLVQCCADADLRARYAASDGLCLGHLRLALERAAQDDSSVARFLADDAARRLAPLTTDLGEYGRKHAWHYRHEVMTENENQSPYRASQFFGGLDGCDGHAK